MKPLPCLTHFSLTPACRSLKPSAILTALILATASALNAAVITWDSPVAVNLGTPSQVITSGSLVVAASSFSSLDSRFNTPTTVNGVAFNTEITTMTTFDGTGFGNGPWITPYPVATDSERYAKLLNGGEYKSSAGPATLTISGLVSGNSYVLQAFTPYWNADYQTRLTATDSVNMGNTLSVPTFVLGHFTAIGTSQTVDWGAAPGSGYGLLSALQVRTAVPEPTSLGLLAAAGTGLLIWRKRRS